ncbi:MAG: hypothetical protein ACMV0F_00325 [Trichlorobacter sp.]|jgi:hypothetical protein
MVVTQDLVLVYIHEKPSFYARVEEIAPDQKEGWWVITLLVLTIPSQVYTWILDEAQLAGAGFTMGGTPIRLEKFVGFAPDIPKPQPQSKNDESSSNIIFLKPRK